MTGVQTCALPISRGSVGNILPEVRLRFDGGGEILAGVPWMFLGYSNEDAGAYFTQGLYHTGDLGHVEAEKLFIDGRKKELIIKGGMNISPKRLEEVLLESGLVKECCVSSVVIDEEERIVCWAVLNGGGEDAGSALNRVVTGRLGSLFLLSSDQRVEHLSPQQHVCLHAARPPPHDNNGLNLWNCQLSLTKCVPSQDVPRSWYLSTPMETLTKTLSEHSLFHKPGK